MHSATQQPKTSIAPAATALLAGGITLTAIAGVCAPSWMNDIGTPGIANNHVDDWAVYDDGDSVKLYGIGNFGGATGVPGTANIAAWNGTTWESVGGGLAGGQFTNAVETFDGNLYAGGYFTNAGGVPGTSKLARWNGSAWQSIDAQLDLFSNSIWGLISWDDGNGDALYIAGNYADIGGNAGIDFFCKYDGATYSLVGGGTIGAPGLPPLVIGLGVHDDGNGEALYVSGRFTSMAGVAANRIVKWDGNQWSALGTGLAGSIGTTGYDMASFEGSLYVGGQSIVTAGGVTVNNIARWDGSQWHAVGDGLDGVVWELEVFDDGGGPALYAFGAFTASGATPINHIAKLVDGSWEQVGSGANATVYSALVVEEGDHQVLYIGGSFTSVNGIASTRAARLVGCPIALPCAADITNNMGGEPDGSVDVFDLLLVLTNWGTNQAGADIAPPDDEVDVFDLLAVLELWGGC